MRNILLVVSLLILVGITGCDKESEVSTLAANIRESLKHAAVATIDHDLKPISDASEQQTTTPPILQERLPTHIATTAEYAEKQALTPTIEPQHHSKQPNIVYADEMQPIPPATTIYATDLQPPDKPPIEAAIPPTEVPSAEIQKKSVATQPQQPGAIGALAEQPAESTEKHDS